MARILLVDNDSVTRQLLDFQLRTSTHEIHSVPSAVIALSMLGFEHFDLVITDLYMPNLSGVALIERTRELHGHPHLPFILLTAETGFSKMMPAVAGDVAAILEKPVGVQALLSAVDAALLGRAWLPARKLH